MKLYRLNVSVYTPFAQIHLDEKDGRLNAMWDDWTSTSKTIGDFTNASVSVFNVCKISVYNELSNNFKGLCSRNLYWVKNPLQIKAKNPKRLRWLPTEDNVDLIAFFTDMEVPILTQTSFEDKVYNGKIIGKNLIGAEERRGYGEGEIIIPRKKNQGIYISKHDVDQIDFFCPIGMGYLLCKPCVKEFIEKKAYTNFQFLEYGEIV